MTALLEMVWFLAISVALAASSSPVFAKKDGPGQAHPTGVSAGPSGSGAGGDDLSKRRGGGCDSRHCDPHPGPGTTQPPCRGGHKGPNGVMIQCQ
jgi:hypothetical protein